MMEVQRPSLVTASVFAASLVAATAWGYSQGLKGTQPVEPVVLSGENIGFRMHGRRDGAPVGTLVVKVDGEWKEVQFAFAVKPVK
jgi:hypothetical protein